MKKNMFYYAPPSFYSQIARLVLVEANVSFDEKVVIPGPPNFGTYAPDYMKINPGGTVPALVTAEEVYSDSRDIVDNIDQISGASSLWPQSETARAHVNLWVSLAYSLSERELAYGTGVISVVGRFVNKMRLRRLKKLEMSNPDMAEIYREKQADIVDFVNKAGNVDHVAELKGRYGSALDQLESHLEGRILIDGENYCVADACWTVSVARQIMMGLNPLTNRPNIDRWYQEMKARPSFNTAEIIDKFRFSIMFNMVRRGLSH